MNLLHLLKVMGVLPIPLCFTACTCLYSGDSRSLPLPKDRSAGSTNIEDPDQIFHKFEDTLKGRIRRLTNNLKNYTSTDTIKRQTLLRTINDLKDMQENLQYIIGSDTKYKLCYAKKLRDSSGNTSYDLVEGKVVLTYGSGARIGDEVIAHEIQHAIQYEQGKLSFTIRDSSDSDPLYHVTLSDISDETEAYKYGILFQGNDDDFKSWTDSMVRKRYPLYDTLPDEHASIFSPLGAILRTRTIRVGMNNLVPHEFYKGWEKDYLKGCDKRPDKGRGANSPCLIIYKR